MKPNYKALIVHQGFGGAGDLILNLPFLQILAQEYNCEIYFLTSPIFRGLSLLGQVPFIKEIILHNFTPTGFRLGYFGLLFKDLPNDITFILKLTKRYTFDFIYQYGYPVPGTDTRYMTQLLLFLRGSWKASLTRRKLSLPGITTVLVDDSLFLPIQHRKLLPVEPQTEDYRADLSFLLRKPPSPLVSTLLEKETPFILLHPFGFNCPALRAPFEKWSAVIGEIRNKIPKNCHIILLGTERDFPDGVERENWYRLCRELGIENLVGQTSFTDLAHLVRNCSLFLGHDSGISHIAWAFNKPRVILYRFPSVGPKPFYQEEETVRLLLPQVNCFPCGYKFWSICPTKKCRDKFDWEKAVSSALELFEKYST